MSNDFIEKLISERVSGEQLLPLIAIAGPTASGKSALALRLACELGGEIVGCDSMQIYRRMDIGTAKPTAAERMSVPHHMIDFADPDVLYSCADYASDAEKCVEDIHKRGKIPVVCGGTGLYLDSLLFDRPWSESGGQSEIREKLSAEAQKENGAHILWERLLAIDPESAMKTHENNVRRVIRALEIFELTGIPKSELDRRGGEPRYDHLVFSLCRPDRAEQNARIESRVDEMIRDGLLEETSRLDKEGVFAANVTASQAIGYKEMLGCVRGECTLAEARESLIIATRQYAKRQLTWFGAKDYVHRIDITPESPDPYPAIRKAVKEYFGF
ncbi:MAG: tRNA (adenosine(37)-N6)-dimethylallyltransferase MiaA [Clostridia bacterium]|nr:tRNA (adenosine(37)-N6)-dimethylallyltransferase MiaA [Clostridia bacterium]